MSTAAKSSTKKTSKVAEPVAVAVAPAPVAAPAKETKTKAKTSKAEAPTVVAAVVPAVVPAAAAAAAAAASTVAAAETPVEEDVSASLQKSIADLHEQFAALKASFSTAAATLKTIEKQAARVIKKADRRKKRKAEAVEGATPKPCIFTQPVKVSAELCSFLGKPAGTEISRSAVTKAVMAYAHAHTLMDKQQIKADATLRKLLTVTEADNLTILNLQKYLNRHYVKATPAAV